MPDPRRGSRTDRRTGRTGGVRTSTPNAPLQPALWAAAVALVLLIASAGTESGLGFLNQPLWQLQQEAVFWRTLAAVCLTLSFIGFGFLLFSLLLTRALLLATMRTSTAIAIAMAMGILITLLCALLKDHWLPGVWPLYLSFTVPSAGLGVAMALLLRQTARPLFGFLLLAATLCLLGIMVVAGAATQILQPAPLPIDGTTLTSADRVRLTQQIRAASPRTLSSDTTKTLSLSATDINQLGVWGLSLGSDHRYLYVSLGDSSIDAAATIGWAPAFLSEPVFLNLHCAAQPSIVDGVLAPGIVSLKIGKLPIPPSLANYLAAGLYALIASDARFAGAMHQLKDVRIRQQQLTATYGGMTMPQGFRSKLFGELGDPDVVAVAFSQHMHSLQGLGNALQQGTIARADGLGTIVAKSFALAYQRTRELGTEPVLENRLTIIALGLALGHPKLEEVVPQLPPGFSTVPQLWRLAPLADRTDWTRHFWVSAALTVLSDQAVSTDLGYLKEELDAGTKGGSGFSFADLGADFSGVAFARAATSDNREAFRLQRQLIDNAGFADFVPTLDDLPEGLSAAALQSEYGGTSGARYLQLVAEIEARVQASPAYARLR